MLQHYVGSISGAEYEDENIREFGQGEIQQRKENRPSGLLVFS
jgi:hypothetical protein